MNRIICLAIISLFFIQCNVAKSEKAITKKTNVIEVTKFMYSVNEYPIAIYEKTFWQFRDEHAKFEISIDENGNFLDEIEKLPKSDGETFEILNYAFIVKNGSRTDTIYADNDLKTWKFIKKGKSEYQYDKEGSNAENLRHKYSFFKGCW